MFMFQSDWGWGGRKMGEGGREGETENGWEARGRSLCSSEKDV